MGAKSEQKKRYIIETAGKVFAEKGFKNVTMKDIAIACDISRGGLYLYYPDTSHLLVDVLKNEELNIDTTNMDPSTYEEGASKLLNLFLHKQKKALFSVKDDLSIAAYEYAFAEDGTDYLRGRFEQVVDCVEAILRMGVESGEFHCSDPHKAALSVVFTLEGLKISSRTIGLSEQEAEDEMRFVVKQLTQ